MARTKFRKNVFVSGFPKSMPLPCSPQTALLLFCGLPGAGKTWLACRLLSEGPRELLARLQEEQRGVRAVRVWHVCFDTVLEALQAQRGVTAFDPVLWRESRELVLQAVRAFSAARQAQTTEGTPQLELPCAVRSEAFGDETAGCLHVLVLDDNMQYRSMRRTYYRLARDARIAVCTLGLPISLELALTRNAERPPATRVDEATMRHMAEVLQWPEPGRFAWERDWLRLAEPQPPLLEEEPTQEQKPEEEPGAGAGAGAHEQPPPWKDLAAALVDSVPSGPDEAERLAQSHEAAASAAQTAASATHQLDLRLRQTAGRHMQQLKTVPAERRSSLAKALTELKRQVVLSCKARWVERGAPADAAELDEELEAASDELDAAMGRIQLT
tara:strand:+ start:81 stop:1238 length:1158 start_codon:yes stop_codon:yes gene_type:complete